MTKSSSRTRSFRIASLTLALAFGLQGMLPYASALASTTTGTSTSKSSNGEFKFNEKNSATDILQAAGPVQSDLEKEKDLTDEEAEALLISEKAKYKTVVDKQCASHQFASTISKLPVLTTATMGAALGNDQDIKEAVGQIQSQKLKQDADKSILDVASAELNQEPALMPAIPDSGKHERIDLAQADGGSAYDQLTRKAILKLIEFERLNTYFRVETTKQSKYRRLRTFLSNEQLSAGVAAFTLIYMYETGRALSRGVLFDTTIRVNSTKLPVIGVVHNFQTRGNFFSLPPNHALEAAWYGTFPFFAIAIAEESFELMENIYDDLKRDKKGLDPATTKAKAVALRDEIDKLLAERDLAAKAQGGSDQEQQMMSAEGKLLRDMRDMELGEYGRYYSAAKRARPAQNAYYATEIAQRSMSLSAAIVGLVAQERIELTTFGVFGVLLTTSAILQPCTPLAAIITSKIQKERAAKQLQSVVTGQQIHSIDELDADRKHFEDLAMANPQLGAYGNRVGVYRMGRDNAAESIALSQREEDAARRLFKTALLLKSFSGCMLGAAGVVAITSYGKFTNVRHILDTGFTFSLLEEIVEWYGAADGPIRYAYREHQDAKSRAAGLLPGQVMERRISNLDKMETSVSGKIVPSVQ